MTYINNRLVIGVAGPITGERVAHAPLLHKATSCLSALGINWLLGDDKAEPVTALEVAHHFVEEKVDAVIGHFNSACAEVVIPIYEKHNITLLLPASSQTRLTSVENKGVFRLCSTDKRQAELMIATINQICDFGAAIEVAIDYSPYSFRVLNAFKEIQAYCNVNLVNINEAPRSETALRLVFATCTNAIQASKTIGNAGWNGVVIYSDDAHIQEFANECTYRDGVQTYVIGSIKDYEALIEDACAFIGAWQQSFLAVSKLSSLSGWLKNTGLFSMEGEAYTASWQLYSVHQQNFNFYKIEEPFKGK